MYFIFQDKTLNIVQVVSYYLLVALVVGGPSVGTRYLPVEYLALWSFSRFTRLLNNEKRNGKRHSRAPR